jgi:hypothetical protein
MQASLSNDLSREYVKFYAADAIWWIEAVSRAKGEALALDFKPPPR